MKSFRPYDYKLYVTGPFQSGKSSLVRTLDPNAVSIDRDMSRPYKGCQCATTTAFDLGRLVWVRTHAQDKGRLVSRAEFRENPERFSGMITKEVELRGVPGLPHFRYVRDTMRQNSNVVLFVVDSSNPEMIPDAVSILAESNAAFGNIPVHIVANKQDRKDAAHPDEVAHWLGVQSAQALSTSNPSACEELVINLLRQIS